MKQITKEGVVSLGDFPQLSSTTVFGSGPDGSATLLGATSPNPYSAWTSITGSGNNAIYTLLRSVYLTSLTVGQITPTSISITLKTNGFKIYCSGTVTITKGSVSCDGNAGSAAAAGAPGAGATVFGTLNSSTSPIPDPASSNFGAVGGTGGTGGVAGTAGALGPFAAPSFGGAGGQGGNGGSPGTTPLGGGATTVSGSFVAFKGLTSPILGVCGLMTGGGGGGGGAGGSSITGAGGGGGGGGAGGGVVAIFASTISLASGTSITAKGGTAGNGATGVNLNACGGGGGGGGGGGLIALVYQTLSNSGTLASLGGAGGAAGGGTGTGSAGTTGAPGADGTILKFNITNRVFE